jgi:chaperone required for assembly of F1-ATPase
MADARPTVKKFWTEVTVTDGAVLLDGRPVRTPLRAPLVLPNAALAQAVAAEWRAVGEKIDPRAMPLTGLANAAIDRPPPAEALAVYGESDVLCYRAETPEPLVARQAVEWDPLLGWASARYDIGFAVTAGIVHVPQPAPAVARLAGAVAALGPWERTALLPLVTIGGSLVAALMLAEGAIDPAAAFDACHLDERWQAELWGEDAEATATRAARRADFLSAALFLSLVREPLRSSA